MQLKAIGRGWDSFGPHERFETMHSVGEEIPQAKRYGNIQVLTARMDPDLSMGDELLKKTDAGNLFMVFGEPDVDIAPVDVDGNLQVTLRGVDVYDPATGAIRSNFHGRPRLLVHRHELRRRELLR
jgi:hypothetical protein